MQWLIDLIIDAIGVPPCYVDRGDPAAYDYYVGDFTKDGAWHDLDLSAIVPAGAVSVCILIYLKSLSSGRWFRLRQKGKVNEFNICSRITPIAATAYITDGVVTLDANRVIQYKIQNTTWNNIRLCIKGWWL